MQYMCDSRICICIYLEKLCDLFNLKRYLTVWSISGAIRVCWQHLYLYLYIFVFVFEFLYICICICVCICIYLKRYLTVSSISGAIRVCWQHLYLYLYIFVFVCICICIWIFIYLYLYLYLYCIYLKRYLTVWSISGAICVRWQHSWPGMPDTGWCSLHSSYLQMQIQSLCKNKLRML